jgi:hypothetical protein
MSGRGFKCSSDEKSDSTAVQVTKSQTSAFKSCQKYDKIRREYDENENTRIFWTRHREVQVDSESNMAFLTPMYDFKVD